MKKTLLFLGLLGMASSVQAQTANLGPWVQVNTTNYATFAPGYLVRRISTVSANVAWAVTEENSTQGNPTTFMVTNNAAGTEFDFGAINAANGAQNFETANISAISATTAVAATFGGTSGGGEILKTTNGGISWTKVSSASQFISTQGGFLDFVYMFDANVGIAVGDPTNGYFEILRTTDGGTTWTRLPSSSIPTPATGEAALVGSFFGRGNNFWFGGASLGSNDPERIFRTTDRGLTWTASPVTALTESITKLAFKDDNNGIAYNTKLDAANAVTSVNLIRTADGGATWTPITPINTATGSFYRYDIDAVDGRYYSVGQRFPISSPAVAADFGSSYSTDAINWTNLNNSQGFFAVDLISGGTGVATGYAGAATDANGVGGLYKATSIVTSNRNAALQSALSVYPNPSTSGVFKVDMGSTLKGSAQLTVVDAVGRQVQSQTLSATAVGSRDINLDLSREKTGIYTLQIRTEGGIATQKLVID